MTEQNKDVQVVQNASQSIVDAAKRESHQWLNPETWRTMGIVAQTFLQSGAMPKSMDTAPKLMVALQAGKEMGLQPLEAINSFYFVNGKVALYGDQAIAQVLRAGHKIEWGNCDHETATVKITRGDNGSSNEATFTMQMATERGLTSNGVYKKYPENMLRFKAFHLCSKFIVADALHGNKIKEVEEAEWVEVEHDVKETEKAVTQKEVISATDIQNDSLEAAINAPEKASEKCIKEIIDLSKEKGKNILDIAKYYNCVGIENLTPDQAEEAIKILKAIKSIEIEEMPAKTESKGAKIIREARDKTIAKRKIESGGWPEDVCRFLRFIEDIPDTEFSEDIMRLKDDAKSGNWCGYEAYPSLEKEIAKVPVDFK